MFVAWQCSITRVRPHLTIAWAVTSQGFVLDFGKFGVAYQGHWWCHFTSVIRSTALTFKFHRCLSSTHPIKSGHPIVVSSAHARQSLLDLTTTGTQKTLCKILRAAIALSLCQILEISICLQVSVLSYCCQNFVALNQFNFDTALQKFRLFSPNCFHDKKAFHVVSDCLILSLRNPHVYRRTSAWN